MSESFRDLEVWQLSMDLALLVDDLVDRFERESNDLRWQMRKASMSIPFNIAEGYRRRSRPAYLNHISIAAVYPPPACTRPSCTRSAVRRVPIYTPLISYAPYPS